MTKMNENSWHGRLFVWSYSAFDRQPPKDFDPWFYCATVGGAMVFLICAFLVLIVLNCATIPVGIFAEPIWLAKPRFRLLAIPGGIPVIAFAVPILLAIGAWGNWAKYGVATTIGPFVATAVLAFFLLGCCVLFNRLRRKLPKLTLGGPVADTDRQAR